MKLKTKHYKRDEDNKFYVPEGPWVVKHLYAILDFINEKYDVTPSTAIRRLFYPTGMESGFIKIDNFNVDGAYLKIRDECIECSLKYCNMKMVMKMVKYNISDPKYISDAEADAIFNFCEFMKANGVFKEADANG